jgi:UDP-4-amino-4,6-dideoxy-N-acetyl-beta-L-altrosamine transaminase
MSDFLSYGKQWLDGQDKKAVLDVLNSDFLTQGPKVEEFEKAICQYTGAKYCVAVSNGTAALHIAVASLNIESGMEGITTPNTFVASSNCLIYSGLTPKFVDIDSKTYNIDTAKIKRAINDNTKVIIPVHFAGQPADMEEISKMAKDKDIYVIEDAAHAIGSKYPNGSKVGCCKYCDMTTFSFHPVKTITTGEGGAITTNDEKIYNKLLLLRSHGITKDPILLEQNAGPWYYEMQKLGFNYRITDIQSALGISQLKKLDGFIERRREIVKKYNEAFSKTDTCTVPYEKPKNYSAFHLYVLKIDFTKLGKTRAEVMQALREKNIGTQVHYIPVHTQPYYQKEFGYRQGDYPFAEDYYNQALSLPLYPKMSDAEVNYVIQKIKHILGVKGTSNARR